MPELRGAVYEPSEPDMPLVAIILSDGEVKLAIPVSSVAEGESKLLFALQGLKPTNMLDDDRR
jgi:hypothetical protein